MSRIWNQPGYFCHRNLNAKCRSCIHTRQKRLHRIAESIAINAASVLKTDMYLLDLPRMSSSTDITSWQDQSISQHNRLTVKLVNENVCQHIEIVWLATFLLKTWHQNDPKGKKNQHFLQGVWFKWTLHGPFALQHFREAYVSSHLLLFVYSHSQC